MCKPTYFNVIHKNLNVHMSMEIPVDKKKALIQYNSLIYELHKHDVIIKYIPESPGLVDAVFAANAGVFIGPNTFVISNFSAIPRIPELYNIKDFFKRTYNIVDTYNKFEGAGDVLYSHNERILWLGYGFRTDVKVASEINFPNLQTLELVDPRFYHLDTCFCPLKDYVMLYVPAFSGESFQKIVKEFDSRIICVSEEDAVNFACNSLYVSITSTLIGHKYSISLKETLSSLGITTSECDMSEFLKSGGSVKCCVLS